MANPQKLRRQLARLMHARRWTRRTYE